MKYYLITGRTPAREYVPARDAIPAKEAEYIRDPDGNLCLVRPPVPEIPAAPEIPAVSSEDIKILIGETNPFDTTGKPFKPQYHQDFGITTKDAWKRLIIVYAQRITHEFIVTPQGLRQHLYGEVIAPAFLLSMLNDGFVKEGHTDGSVEKIIYWKQKGRIEDDLGKTYTAKEMLKILEDQ